MENPYLNKRQYEVLLEEAKRNLEKEPNNPAAHEFLSSVSALGDRYEETLNYLERTLISVRNEPLMHLLKAHCHLKLKEYDLMKQEYLRFTKMEAGQAYWEDAMLAIKIDDDEELQGLIELINEETRIRLIPFINTIHPQK
ncbi:MAG: hypothetical protein IT236_11660 [Bacteroidia bacterium]|nr:hypothetical protein [Bacteroidia bacterium]